MDFMQRGSHQLQSAGGVVGPSDNAGGNHKNKSHGMTGWMKGGSLVLLFSMVILVVAVLISLATGNNVKTESKYVNTKELQAVFLNGGQVYFGNIASLNSQYLRLDNIYYLRVNQTVQPNQTNSNSSSNSSTQSNDISLVKLGGELHCPEDQMLINRTQVIFWENLRSDGQVAKAVADYVKANPGSTQPSCTTSTTTNPTSNSSSSSNTSTNSSSSSSTTKKQ